MSAELRRAAADLRAQVDRLTTDTERWDEAFPVRRVYADMSTYERIIMHPAVALAVADWLDDAASTAEACEQSLAMNPSIDIGNNIMVRMSQGRALAAARTYLNGESA